MFGFQANRYAAAFSEPVDSNEVPNYYQVIKVPMGKLILIFLFKQLQMGEEINNLDGISVFAYIGI